MTEPGEHLQLHRAPSGLLKQALAPALPPRRPRLLALAATFLLGIIAGGALLQPEDSPTWLSASPELVPIKLTLHAPAAATVSVAGSWNAWSPSADPLQRAGDGLFTAVLAVPQGTHEYMFVVDGTQWVVDPTAAITRDDGFGQRNAVLHI